MHHKQTITILILILFLCPSISGQNPKFSDQDCMECHGKPEIHQITQSGAIRSLYVDPEEWAQDAHHAGNLTCVDCHKNANPILHFREGFIDVDCARCHPVEAEEYQKNIHLTFRTVTPGKTLPLCYDCHTKHSILVHDNPRSSVHESNIGKTCGACHPEVMVKGILSGTSLGKLSGHRKGDSSEKFDMNVCIHCHYQDSAHGAKRVYKEFCSRCHDVRSKGNLVMGPTHLNAARWSSLNFIGSGLFFFLLFLSGTIIVYRSRKGIFTRIMTWIESMKMPAAPEEPVPGTEEKEPMKENEKTEP